MFESAVEYLGAHQHLSLVYPMQRRFKKGGKVLFLAQFLGWKVVIFKHVPKVVIFRTTTINCFKSFLFILKIKRKDYLLKFM